MRDKSGYSAGRRNNQGGGNQRRGHQRRGNHQYNNRNYHQNRNNWNQSSGTPFGQPNHGESQNTRGYYGPSGGASRPQSNQNQNPNSNSNNVRRFPQDEARETRLKGVNKDTWDQFTFDEKIESQYEAGPYSEFYLKDQIRADTKEWMEQKQKAAKATVNQLMEEMTRDASSAGNQSEYESDSGDSYMQDVAPLGQGSLGVRDLPYPRSIVENFIDSLQYNLIFNVGFDLVVVNPDDEKSCYCPCSKYMTKWRDNFKATYMIEKDKCTSYHRRAAPKGLMDHLRKLGGEGAYLHRGIEIYITKLYENYWGAVGHKALYNENDAMHKLAIAAETRFKNDEKVYLENSLERLQRENKEQEEKLRQNNERIKRLEQVSQKQAEKYKEKMELYKKLGLERKENVKLDEATVEKWRKVTRVHFSSIRKILTMAASKDETIKIKLPFHFILQDFFDDRCNDPKEQKPQTSTFLFRDLKKGNGKQPNKDYSYKLFLPWNVEFDAPKVGNKSMQKGLKAVDEGGPTSRFISDFCMQLGDLSVMLPFISEVKYNVQNVEGDNDWKTDLLVPLKGSNVMYGGEMMTVTKYSKETGMANLSYGDDGTQCFEVQRKDFVVKTIPVKIFHSTAGGSIPERDEWFSASYDMYVSRKFTPAIEKKDFENKARLYFRAIGRFLLHVIYDGNNPIPTSVLPELYRNVLLRNCEPDSDEYDDSDVLEHFMNLESNKDAMKKGNNKFYGLPFEVYEIDKEGVINEDNFIKEFVPEYMIENRKKNINAFREGLTLDGEFPIDILACQPLQAISQQFFSNDTCSVEHLIALLRPEYEKEVDDKISKENHDRFIKETMPEALRTLARKNSSFLLDFVLFVSGSRCIPYTQGMPDFNISIFFNVSTGENHLPSCHTCENLMHVPWGVYDNDAEVFAKKLEKAVEFGKDGFDMT